MMPENKNACPIADSDTEVRYLAGRLTSDEAEEFERHYFECDTCAKAVERGAEIRSALGASAISGARPMYVSTDLPDVAEARAFVPRRRSFVWRPLIAAAAVLAVVTSLWRFNSPASSRLQAPEAVGSADHTRGVNPPLTISASTRERMLVATWSSAIGARSYRVRLLEADGTLLFERQTADTSIALSVDSISKGRLTIMFWDVQALNELRRVISTSSLTQARQNPNPP